MPEETTANPMVKAFEIAFAEWDRRYREDPENFMSEVEHLLQNTATTYGVLCSAYFIELLNELAKGQPWMSIGAEAKG